MSSLWRLQAEPAAGLHACVLMTSDCQLTALSIAGRTSGILGQLKNAASASNDPQSSPSGPGQACGHALGAADPSRSGPCTHISPPNGTSVKEICSRSCSKHFQEPYATTEQNPSGSLVPHTVKKQGEPILLSGMGGRVNACRQWPYKEVLRPSSDADACILS